MKKLLSLLLVLTFVLSVVTISASAQEIEEEPQNVLHFDTNTALHWDEEYTKVYCHIWEYGGEPFFNWQSRKEKCTDEDNDGVWTYNLDEYGVELEEGKLYALIFSNDKGQQIANLLFDKTVLGDTAYCDGLYMDSPEGIKYYFAYWRNQKGGLDGFGPELYINSIGEVKGNCIPNVTTAQAIFEEFLVNRLENTRIYSGKEDQDIIDDIAVKIELTVDEVIEAISNSGEEVDWNWYESPVELGTFTPVTGDADGDMTLSVMDATTIQRYKAEIEDINERLLEYCDIDSDSKVSVMDATYIQQKLSQLV
mgnify:CR=1 FL=1